jgi:hypothetical protein
MDLMDEVLGFWWQFRGAGDGDTGSCLRRCGGGSNFQVRRWKGVLVFYW